ncbi:MAG: arginine repressor [Phycisphaerae bacterium]
MGHKQLRQQRLLQLVRERAIGNQAQIVQLMRRFGLEATQASVSRDMRELGLIKVRGRYVPPSGLAGALPDDPVAAELSGLITTIQPVGANLVVLRTPPGEASSAAVTLDRQQIREIAGTLAGDDTIFIAVKSRSDQGRVVARLRGWVRTAPAGAASV